MNSTDAINPTVRIMTRSDTPSTPTATCSSSGVGMDSTPSKSSAAAEVSPCKSSTTSETWTTTAEDWYLQGERVWYDPREKQIVEDNGEEAETQERFRIFRRIVLPETESSAGSTSNRWMTFLPSNPEGSYGFHLVEEALMNSPRRCKTRCDTEATEISNTHNDNESVNSCHEEEDTETSAGAPSPQQEELGLARLYLDYEGQGDSDTPINSSSSNTSTTKQRADLVEALWKAHGIQRSVVVSAGDSSLVVMELLQRQRQRLAAGSPFPKILHVLSLNGRYVAKTRHSSQLATVTQLLRTERMGPSLAAKAQRSDFTLAQCLGPYLKGSSRQVRKQVQKVVRRNQGAHALVEMARTVDDHLLEKHRYRWHLPHLLKAFTLDQGITFRLVTTTRSGQRQVHLVKQHLQEYQLLDEDNGCGGSVLRYSHYEGRTLPTSSFLLDSNAVQLQTFIRDIRQLACTEIPMSDNSMPAFLFRQRCRTRSTTYDDEMDNDERSAGADDDGEDSWHPNEEEMSHQDREEEEDEEPSLDTRLDREIVVDVAEMDDDDFDLF